MSASRLELALSDGLVALPDGIIALFGARGDHDLGVLHGRDVCAVQGFRPDVAALEKQGFSVAQEPPTACAASIVFLPRSKAEGRAMIAKAATITSGPVIVDGQKTDGIESVLRDVRKRVVVSGALSKHHGKLFVFNAGGDFGDWADPGDLHPADGFVTRVGVFSAERVDRGSAVLAAALPARLKGQVADFGAGWGYLAKAALKREGVEAFHLVEADYVALQCAKRNVTDPRAQFHWSDVAEFTPETRLDVVITNPPFHTGRAAEPALGIAFINAAARVLAPSGQLWLVANRHLPYERALEAAFAQVNEVGDDPAFKVYHAARPKRRPK